MIPTIDVPEVPNLTFTEEPAEDDQLDLDLDQKRNSVRAVTRIELQDCLSRVFEKCVIIHRDENGFGLRIKGNSPVFVEHVHENGAAWRAGVRAMDIIHKVNGKSVGQLDHKQVVLMFKSCSRFAALGLLSSRAELDEVKHNELCRYSSTCSSGRSMFKSLSSSPAIQRLELTGWTLSKSSLIDNNQNFHRRSCLSNQSSSQLQLPNTSYSMRSSMPGSPSSQRSSIYRANDPFAHRSESVSHCTSRQVQTFNPAQHSSDNEQQVCISCRSSLEKSREVDEQPTCQQCRLLIEQHQRQRLYGSLRVEHQLRDKKQPAEQINNRNLYRLGQSASSNSLPLEKAANKTSATGEAGARISSRSPTTNKRLEIIREFIDTEKAHTDRLRCLDELFYRPLKLGAYMTNEQLRSVFSCHRTLYKIHRQIYRTLLSTNYSLCSEPMIGSALVEIFEGDLRKRLERAACSFCSSQSTNTELLNKLTRRDTKVGEFLARVTSQQMVGRLGIKDLLASCFQRLTKYPLLLENLLKATPQSLAQLRSELNRKKRKHKSMSCEAPDESQTEQVENGNESDELDERDANSMRMLAIGLAEEREFIERALNQSRQILVSVNDAVKVAMSHNKLKEIWKRTDKYPGVPLIDISKQQVLHEGLLTLRLSKRSFDVYVLLLNDYIIILTREGQDKYRLKFFTPEGKSSSSNSQSVYSPVFVIDEHLATRDAATDENGFYLLCKRKDDSRIYEFASRSPAERLKWRDRIQWTIERQMNKGERRASCESTITKSSSEISAKQENEEFSAKDPLESRSSSEKTTNNNNQTETGKASNENQKLSLDSEEPTKIEGTISYVEDDGIVMPANTALSKPQVEQAVQVSLFEEREKSKT